MSNALSSERLEDLREAYFKNPSVRAAAKLTGVSRQTVRRYAEQEGWSGTIEQRYETAGALHLCPVPITPATYEADWTFLNKLFERMKLTGENLDFEKHIRSLVTELASKFGVTGRAGDFLLLETAVMEFMSYRRFVLKAIQAEECNFKTPDQCARTVERWRNMADRSLTQVRQIFRELEIKHRKVPPNGAGNVFVGPTQINMNRD